MKKGIGVIIAIVVIVAILLAGSYNSLVVMEEDVELARANVQTMMQRRLELIPDLVSTVKSYAKHEEKVFGDIADARSKLNESFKTGDTAQISEANENVTRAVNSLLAVAEAYPQLTSGQQYTNLMDQLEGSVNRISIAREEYNAVVAKFNKQIRRFPSNIFASIFGFEQFDTFKASEGADKTNMVDFGEE